MKNGVRFSLILGILLSSAGLALAQPDSLWSVTFGGPDQDSLWGMIRTSDGNYIAVGSKTTETSADAYLVKFNGRGRLMTHAWFGNDTLREELHDVTELASGGLASCGVVHTGRNDVRRMLIITTDDYGSSENIFTYGEDGGYDDGYSIIETSPTDVAIGGVSYPGNNWQDDFAIRVISSMGDQQGFQHYGDQNVGEYGLDLIKTNDSSYAMVGQSFVFDDGGEIVSGEMAILKTTSALAELWHNSYRVANSVTTGNSIIQTPDSGYVMCGAVGEIDREWGILGWDCWLIKVDARGDRVWAQAYDLGRDEWGMQVIPVDSGYVIVGTMGTNNGGVELFNTDAFLLRVNLEGERRWSGVYGGRDNDDGLQVIPTRDGGYMIGGNTSTIGAGLTDFWVMQTSPDPQGVEFGQSSYPLGFVLSSYPNPFNSTTTISYSVSTPGFVRLGAYDFGGKLVSEFAAGYRTGGTYHTTWDAKALPSGQYLIRLERAKGVEVVRSVVLIK